MTFGDGRPRQTQENPAHQRRRQREVNAEYDFPDSISPERWVDIICSGLIIIFLVLVIINWNAFHTWLFGSIIFPIVFVGARLLGILALICVGIGWLFSKLWYPRRWYY